MEMSPLTSPPFMSALSFFLFFLLLSFHTNQAICVSKSPPDKPFSDTKARKLESTNVIIRGNATIYSLNRNFELVFFTPNGEESNWYLGIRYSSLPTQTTVWVANRENPTKNITQSFGSKGVPNFSRLAEHKQWKSQKVQSFRDRKSGAVFV